MDDKSQDVEKKGTYGQWSNEETKLLLELMVDAAARDWHDTNGGFSRPTVQEKILPALNSKLGIEKTYTNYTSRLKFLRNKWSSYSALMRFSSGFGYDSITKRFTASDEVWDEYLKAHPKDFKLRTTSCDDYEDLKIAVGNGVAVGANAIGLGSVTDARTSSAKDPEIPNIEDLEYDDEMGVFIPNHEERPFNASPISSPNNPPAPTHRVNKNKRSRPEYEGNPNVSTTQNTTQETLADLSATMRGVYGLLEKRDRERQYTNWDAVKEVPNLDDETRFKTMELLSNKEIKEMFLKMSPEERSVWIAYKMRKS